MRVRSADPNLETRASPCGAQVAVKIPNNVEAIAGSIAGIEALEEEIGLLQDCRHHNVVAVHGLMIGVKVRACRATLLPFRLRT